MQTVFKYYQQYTNKKYDVYLLIKNACVKVYSLRKLNEFFRA